MSGNSDVPLESTVVSPTNIALLKYWGKSVSHPIEDNQPLADSLSITLNSPLLRTTTEVTIRKGSTPLSITLNLNGDEAPITDRIKLVVNDVLKLKPDVNVSHVDISTSNNFPTAAGLASSASGLSALTIAMACALGVPDEHPALTHIARKGSGSACRSLYGGFVEWRAGVTDLTQPCIRPVEGGAKHWKELRILICIFENDKKKVSSTEGMNRSVETSSLLAHRISTVVPHRLEQFRLAIANKDFPSFAKLVIQESNQLHSICLDSYPPIRYLNKSSFELIDLVHDSIGTDKCAYTFDAGPNAHLILEEHNLSFICLSLAQKFVFQSVDPLLESYLSTIPGDSVDKPLMQSIILAEINEKGTHPLV